MSLALFWFSSSIREYRYQSPEKHVGDEVSVAIFAQVDNEKPFIYHEDGYINDSTNRIKAVREHGRLLLAPEIDFELYFASCSTNYNIFIRMLPAKH